MRRTAVPADTLPACCRDCAVEYFASDPMGGAGVTVTHNGNEDDRLQIPQSVCDDLDVDIAGTYLTPWLERLHEAPR